MQAGSGSTWRSPGDIRSDDALEELKMTHKASFSLKTSDWDAISGKARAMGREPRMVIDFLRPSGKTLRLIVEEA